MNAKAWFYGTSFHGNIDRTSGATQGEIDEQSKKGGAGLTCPLCKGNIELGWHTVARIDGKLAHDYCIRTKVER